MCKIKIVLGRRVIYTFVKKNNNNCTFKVRVIYVKGCKNTEL